MMKGLPVTLLVILFAVRGVFYCLLQPMWEGIDEWAHFGYIDHIVRTATLPVKTDEISPEIRRSLEIAPARYSTDHSTFGLRYDDFWRLMQAERASRIRELRACCVKSPETVFTLSQYEAQQPPLYYLLLALPCFALRDASLPTRMLAARLFSLALVSLVIPVTFAIATRIFNSERDSGRIAWAVTLAMVCLPGLYVDVCRVGNESLAILLSALFVLSALRLLDRDAGLIHWVLAGTLLGSALLTKSYALGLVPVLPVLGAIKISRERNSQSTTIAGVVAAMALALSIAGWWYVNTWYSTGTLSGEQLDVAATRFSLGQKVAAMFEISWGRVADSMVSTYIWTSGWSFLTVRSWMYRIFEAAGIAALSGVLVKAIRLYRQRNTHAISLTAAQVITITCPALFLVAGLLYQALMIFLVKGVSTSPGWYLYATVSSEVVLLGVGATALLGTVRARVAMASLSLAALGLDLYTVNLMLVPYYTGLTAHDASGRLRNFHLGMSGVWQMFNEAVRRLSSTSGISLSPFWVGFWWVGYLCATCGLVISAFQVMRSGQVTIVSNIQR